MKKSDSKQEFFDYLAYHGVKNHKAAELAKLKEAEELAACTFKPNADKPESNGPARNVKVFENLDRARKDMSTYALRKEQLEMQGCTFRPTIDKKSKQLVSSQRQLVS